MNGETGSGETAAAAKIGATRAGDEVVTPLSVPGTGLVASLRNVFISTPDPNLAPAHPADPISTSQPGSPASSTSSLSGGGKEKRAAHRKHKHEDYINTLEISDPKTAASHEAVVVVHGYAAAMG